VCCIMGVFGCFLSGRNVLWCFLMVNLVCSVTWYDFLFLMVWSSCIRWMLLLFGVSSYLVSSCSVWVVML